MRTPETPRFTVRPAGRLWVVFDRVTGGVIQHANERSAREAAATQNAVNTLLTAVFGRRAAGGGRHQPGGEA